LHVLREVEVPAEDAVDGVAGEVIEAQPQPPTPSEEIDSSGSDQTNWPEERRTESTDVVPAGQESAMGISNVLPSHLRHVRVTSDLGPSA
jgi:hypothetical protein